MEENELLFDFSYIDMFGNKTILHRTVSDFILQEKTEGEVLIEMIMQFWIACGFAKESANEIILQMKE